MRSVATSSRASSIAYRSRTLPRPSKGVLPRFVFKRAVTKKLVLAGTESPIFEGRPTFVNVPLFSRKPLFKLRQKWRAETEVQLEAGATPSARALFRVTGSPQTGVMFVTDRPPNLGDTPIVNMVRRAVRDALLEPGDTREQWKGEAAATSLVRGITSGRALPTSGAGHWPRLSCVL